VQDPVLQPPVQASPWAAYFNRWTESPITGRPANLKGCSITANPVRVSGEVVQLEPLLLPGFALPASPCFVEPPVVHQGWLHMVKSDNLLVRKETRSLLLMHDFVDGEADLVFYEREKSQSIVPGDMYTFSPMTLSVKMMPKRTVTIANGRVYFQIRVSESTETLSTDELEQLLVEATDNSEAQVKLVVIISIAGTCEKMSGARAAHLARFLAARLALDSIPVKIKALNLIANILQGASKSVVEELRRVCFMAVTDCATFDAVDPMHGDKPAAVVRTNATGVLTTIQRLGEPGVLEARTQVPKEKVTKLVVGAESQEDVDGWIMAIKKVSHSDNPWTEDASDDEEVTDNALEIGKATVKSVHTSLRMASKKFSGKATAPILDSDHGDDDDMSLPYDLEQEELKIKSKRSELVPPPLFCVSGGRRQVGKAG
jgi:hypothetical protein